MKKKAIVSWSSGKDSAWALHEVQKAGDFDVVGLLTTINSTHERVAMHAVRRSLLHAQARAAGLPLFEVELPWPCPNGEYERLMTEAVVRAVQDGITHVIFGDLFLEDIRAYREKMLKDTGLCPVFPLWGRDTKTLGLEMIEGGLVAHLTAVDPKQLSSDFVGRRYDGDLLAALPSAVDPCGENGEFHSFVSAGPMFRNVIGIVLGEKVERDGFAFCDILHREHVT